MISPAQSLVEALKAAEITRAISTRVSNGIFRHNLYVSSWCPKSGISYLQQSIIGKSGQTKEDSPQGDTSHHAAVDEAHPEKISEFLRHQNRSLTEEDVK